MNIISSIPELKKIFSNYQGCGWPQHMLIPKGTAQGLQAELFIMISDYELDRVEQNLSGTCNDAASYCGVRDRRKCLLMFT
jgi:tyrosinase